MEHRIDFIGVMARNICEKYHVHTSLYLSVRIEHLNRYLRHLILMSLVKIRQHISIWGQVMTEVMHNLLHVIRTCESAHTSRETRSSFNGAENVLNASYWQKSKTLLCVHAFFPRIVVSLRRLKRNCFFVLFNLRTRGRISPLPFRSCCFLGNKKRQGPWILYLQATWEWQR
jgi:hypothetical protein